MQNVIQAFQKILDEMYRTGSFYSGDMRNFLEPIFEREGYRDETESKEILVMHDAGVGDFVNLSPSLRAIREKFPDSRVTMICNLKSYSLARTCPYVDSIYFFKKDFDFETFPDLYKTQMDLSKRLLNFKFDLAICFCHYIDGILLAYMSGAKKIVHYAGTLICDPNVWKLSIVIDLVNWKIPIQDYPNHIADRYLGLIESMFEESIEDRSLEVWFEPRCMKLARDILKEHGFLGKRIFAISFGGTESRKHYPPEKYVDLIETISDEIPNARFIVIGGKDDRHETEIFMDLFNYDPRIANLVEDLTYAETAAILSMCEMYIGNDTGTMHVAAAIEIPCLVPVCFPADHDITPNSVLQMYSPRGVSSVWILPEKSLPECYEMEDRFFGCKSDHPHCIAQIKFETMINGFHLLQNMIQNDERRCNWVF